MLMLSVYESTDEDILVVDIEVQNGKGSAKYFVGRFFYYIGSLFTAQKNDISGFEGKDYANVKPILAVWIRSSLPDSFVVKSDTNAEIEYNEDSKFVQLLAELLRGFIKIVVISAGADWRQENNEAIECISQIFRNPVDKAEQQNDLRKEGIDLTQELAAKMRDYDDVLFPEGYQKIKDLEALIAKLTAENKQKMAMKDQQINDLNKKIEELEKLLSKSDAKLNQ